MVKTFNQAVSLLENYIPTPDKKHPGKFGLARMKYLMELLGNPQLKYPTIHVGGTSGKGSTSTFIASILATKYKVGLHTSPHLLKITERIKVLSNNREQITNNKPERFDIPERDFIDLVNYVRPFIEKVGKSKLGPPSYFEIVTAMAFIYFYRKKVDIAVIEVGMGGRYDATNVINPLVAVITNVGLDHTEILGDTVEKIAKDKVGIIKSGIQVVSGVRKTSIIQIIEVQCRKKDASLSFLERDFTYKIKKISEEESVFDYFGKLGLKNLRLNLLGEFQVENAALAIRAVENVTMKQCNNETITEEDVRTGLINAYIPGRLEIISSKPMVILDGAHNPDKVKALVKSVKDIFPHKKITAIIAIKGDKNAEDMLTQLIEISSKVVFTGFRLTADLGIISSYDPQELLKIAQTIDRDKPMAVIENAGKAVREIMQIAKHDELILVTGSLYLVGEVKKVLSRKYYV